LNESHGLRTLYIGFNPLKSAPSKIPQRLKEFHIAGCGIKKIPSYKLKRAEFAWFHSNELESFDVSGVFSDVSRLRMLDVSMNSIRSDLHKHLKTVPEAFELHDTQHEKKSKEKKEKEKEEKPHYLVGHVDMCGRRQSMEDYMSYTDDVLGDGSGRVKYFGLFDGHGGSQVSTDSGKFVQKFLCENMPSMKDKLDSDSEIEQLLANALNQANKQFPVTPILQCQGSTALIAVVIDDRKLYIANIGDSRGVLFREGEVTRVSVDHKPLDSAEYQRIINVNGWVSPDGRIMGVLGVARALGDKALFPFVSSQAYTASYDLVDISKTDPAAPASLQFLILACDGVWDVVSDEQACNVVRNALQQFDGNSTMAATALRDWAFLNGSGDNISVMIIPLPGKKV